MKTNGVNGRLLIVRELLKLADNFLWIIQYRTGRTARQHLPPLISTISKCFAQKYQATGFLNTGEMRLIASLNH